MIKKLKSKKFNMTYIYLLAAVPFIVTSVIFFLKCQNWKSQFDTKEKEHINVLGEYNSLKDDVKKLNSNYLREGYYNETVNFAEIKDSTDRDPYECVIYVYETDKYINGESKLVLNKVEVISGFHQYNYDYAKQTIKSKFCSVKPTKDIIWLESEENLKEIRKKKLTEIFEKIN